MHVVFAFYCAGGAIKDGVFMSIKCERCGAMLSNAADKCPHCLYPTPQNQGRCRVCNTVLSVSEHRYEANSNYIIHGTTSSYTYTRHVPCTNCGEPEPLRLSLTQRVSSSWARLVPGGFRGAAERLVIGAVLLAVLYLVRNFS